jgi:hypothetical protein
LKLNLPFFLFDNSVNIWREVQFVKLNIPAINPNRLLFSLSEVKMFASEPSFFSLNTKENRQNCFLVGIISLCDFRQKKGKKKYCRTEWYRTSYVFNFFVCAIFIYL